MIHPEPEGKPWKDEIVEEVRLARERLFAECDFDLGKLADRLQREQQASGRATVTFPRRTLRKNAWPSRSKKRPT